MSEYVPPYGLKGNALPGREGVPPSTQKEVAPNPTTLKAMEELEQGKGKQFNSAEELFEDLDL